MRLRRRATCVAALVVSSSSCPRSSGSLRRSSRSRASCERPSRWLTSATLFGFIAASGIQLNLVTAVLSSIVIGVGIDYAIHFVAAIDFARTEGDGYVLRAVDRAGRPIIANALGIAVALTALWLSPFRIHPHISMIMWVSMTTAALTALVIIPALLPRDGVAEGAYPARAA